MSTVLYLNGGVASHMAEFAAGDRLTVGMALAAAPDEGAGSCQTGVILALSI